LADDFFFFRLHAHHHKRRYIFSEKFSTVSLALRSGLDTRG
jgi:hypothetical protein